MPLFERWNAKKVDSWFLILITFVTHSRIMSLQLMAEISYHQLKKYVEFVVWMCSSSVD